MQWIDTPDALATACAHWRQQPWVCVDTEFLRTDTYHARLCLVQIGDASGQACIDTLALPDLSPLWALLQDPGVLKVLHACGQDFEIFVEQSGVAAAPLFDSQIAATLIGLGDQLGYAGLVEKRLGITVDKGLSRTDWSRRPLRADEIAYAAGDVEHLATLYPALQDAVDAAGRLGWLAEDCADQCNPAHYRTEPADAWRRLKGLNRLDAAAQTRAAALAAWRERRAASSNRPRKWILDDAPLYRLAERAPDSLQALAALEVLPPKTLERHGAELLQVLAESAAEPARIWMPEELEGEAKARLKRLQGLVREAAERLDVPPGFLASRAQLEALVREGQAAPVAVLKGWRRSEVGEALLAAL